MSEQYRDQQHSVYFYRDDPSLCDLVGRFIAEGLQQHQPGIVIATPSHRNAILRCLTSNGLHPDRLCHNGDLVMLDARETLAGFMFRGSIDGPCFRTNVGRVFAQARRGREHSVVRAYGEIVDVLWKDGKASAAVHLEAQWNELQKEHPFSLMCGYSMGNFYEDVEGAGFHDVCAHHNHIVSPAMADA